MNPTKPITSGSQGIQGILDVEKTLASPIFTDDNRKKFSTAAELCKAVEESRNCRLLSPLLTKCDYSLKSKVFIVSGAVAAGVCALVFGRIYGVLTIGLLGSRIFLDYKTNGIVEEGDILEEEIFGSKYVDEKKPENQK
jgi:hypothetical protein